MKITDIIDQQNETPERAPVQGYVPAALRQQVVDQMKRDKEAGIKITWDLFLEAACRAYISERKSKR